MDEDWERVGEHVWRMDVRPPNEKREIWLSNTTKEDKRVKVVTWEKRIRPAACIGFDYNTHYDAACLGEL